MKCPGPRCGNEVARLWKHPRIAEAGYPDGLCTTCYVIEKASWPATTDFAPISSIAPKEKTDMPAQSEEKTEAAEPAPAPKPKKTCRHCGAEKGAGKCKACGKDGRGGSRAKKMPASEEKITAPAVRPEKISPDYILPAPESDFTQPVLSIIQEICDSYAEELELAHVLVSELRLKLNVADDILARVKKVSAEQVAHVK